MLRQTVQGRIAELLPHADLLWPSGPPPFPLVVQLHGCGGKKPFLMNWAEAARRAGVAVLIVDSFAHRRISRVQAYCTVCTGARLPGAERAGDVFAAMEWARHEIRIDSNRIALAGWSHGGWTILDALALKAGRQMAQSTGLDDLAEEPLRGLVGAFLVYPYAGIGCLARRQALRLDVNTLALVCGEDVIVGSRDVVRALASIRKPGAPIDTYWLDGCTHAFDEPEARDVRVRHNPAQVAHAQRIYVDFLSKVFVMA